MDLDVNPYQYKSRKMHLNLESLVKKELNRLLDAKIIFLVEYSIWLANLVSMRKKNGEMWLCIDFWNLKRASQKDKYPIPPMEKNIQCVSSSKMLSLLDGLSRCNQILVSRPDQTKMTFHTKWGPYAYRKMTFGLINTSSTFQRAMDIAFCGLINK